MLQSKESTDLSLSNYAASSVATSKLPCDALSFEEGTHRIQCPPDHAARSHSTQQKCAASHARQMRHRRDAPSHTNRTTDAAAGPSWASAVHSCCRLRMERKIRVAASEAQHGDRSAHGRRGTRRRAQHRTATPQHITTRRQSKRTNAVGFAQLPRLLVQRCNGPSAIASFASSQAERLVVALLSIAVVVSCPIARGRSTHRHSLHPPTLLASPRPRSIQT